MAWQIVFRCDRCHRKYRLRTGDFRFYAVAWQSANLPDWERVGCHDREGWCRRCRCPRAMELVPSLDELELRRVSLLERGEAEQVARAEAAIRWRQERSSPPRCLHCGSASVEPLGEEFRHPGCGGRFEVAETCHLNTSVAFVVPAEGPHERGWLGLWWSNLIPATS